MNVNSAYYLVTLQDIEASNVIASPSAPRILFFGSRQKDRDFLYGDELESWKNQGMLSDLVCAFSRDQPQKVYVQHRMKEANYAASIWKVLGESPTGCLFVAG